MGLYYVCRENKGADQVISAFVFAYSKSRFSHDGAHTAVKIAVYHYKNMPMQHTAIFLGYKNDNFQLKFFDYFHKFA